MSDDARNEILNPPDETVAPPSGSAGLEVEGEPGVYWCARHRKVKTRLRCGRCEAPICPKCTVYGPTGARCKNCLSYKGTHMYQIAPQHYAAAIVVSLVLGVALGFIASIVGFFAIFYAPLAGVFMGRAISFVTKNKRGLPMALIGSAGLIFGAILTLLPHLKTLLAVSAGAAMNTGATGGLMSSGITTVAFTLLYLALALPGVWYWLK